MSSRNLLSISRGLSKDSIVPVKRVLVLYIGGTIGMKHTPQGWVPSKGLLSHLLLGNSKFHDVGQSPGTMPVSQWGIRVVWVLQERDVLLDSSDMDHTDWVWVAQQIRDHYAEYDGFVLIQGTDTMTYTASALSFMLRYLSKSVVITGSQVPMLVLPNDAESNLFASICIAAHFEIPEVAVFFNGVLLRGNRTTKFDASGFDAFVSHNFPPLLSWGPVVKVNWDSVRTASEVEFLQYPFQIVTDMCTDVAVLRFFPGISEALLRSVLQPPLRGCILQTYGQGNVSMRASHILQTLRAASERGVLLVSVTQCPRGTVTASYATGRALQDAGVQLGYDMTVEAAVCKVAYLLGRVDSKEMTLEEARQKISVPLRGELTAPTAPQSFSFRDGSFVHAVTKTMEKLLIQGPQSQDTKNTVSAALFPVLLGFAASQGDLQTLESILKQSSAGPDVGDLTGKTALHAAAEMGHLMVVKYLVERARANVNALDRRHRTPLDMTQEVSICEYLKEHGGLQGTCVGFDENEK